MYICRVIGKEAVSASPRALLKDARKGCRRGSLAHKKMLGRAQEAGRHEARVTGGWLAKLAGGWRKYAPEMLFAEHEGSGGSLGLWGFVKALFGGSFGARRSLRLLRGFGAQQGSLGLKGYGLAVPLSFHRFIIISN